MFFTYIVESQVSGRWYYGHSSDIERRVREHNLGQNKSTRGKGPWMLIFLREFDSKIEANRFELELKRLKNKEYIKRVYPQFFRDVAQPG